MQIVGKISSCSPARGANKPWLEDNWPVDGEVGWAVGGDGAQRSQWPAHNVCLEVKLGERSEGSPTDLEHYVIIGLKMS